MLNDIIKFTNSHEFATINKEQIEKIKSRLPELKRTSDIIGHSTSQTSYSLQTMQMISDSPLSRMKQCISQINKKYNALRESYFKVEKKKLRIEKLSKKNDKFSKLEVSKLQSEIEHISPMMENALRQIGMFQDMYDSIRKNNKIAENWTEKDFEKQEIQHMIKSSFRIAIQDVMAQGHVSKAAVEYWEQQGIHPQVGTMLTVKYLDEVREKIVSGEDVDIKLMYDFLDEMADKFKDSHKIALERIGLDEIGSEQFMAEGQTKPQ